MTTLASKPAGSKAASSRPSSPLSGVTIDPIKVVRRHVNLLIAMAVTGIIAGYGAFLYFDQYHSRYTGRVGFELLPQLREALEPTARLAEQGESVLRAARTEAEYLTSLDVLGAAVTRDVREKTEWARQFVGSDGNFAFDLAIADLADVMRPVVTRDTNLFFLEWSTDKAADVPVVLNAVADAYIAIRASREQTQLDATIKQFEVKYSETNKKIADAAADLDSFIRSNNLTVLEDSRNSQLMVGVQDLQRQMTEAVGGLAVAESLKRQTDEKLRGTVEFSSDDRRRAEDDPNLRNLLSLINQQRIQLVAARERFGSQHSEVNRLEQLVKASMEEKESGVRDRIRRNLEADLKDSILRIEQMQRLQKDLEQEYRIKEAQLKDTAALISEAKNKRKVMEQLEDEANELQSVIRDTRLMRERPDARRVFTAFPATTPRVKSFPSLKMFLPLGLALFVGLTLGVIFLREILDQRVKGSSDLAVIPGAKVLGSIPDIMDDPTRCERTEMVVMERPQSVLAESYRQVSVPLSKSLAASESKILLLVGGLPGAGTTSIASNLAAIDSVAGRKVLVIDANFRRPGVPAALGVREDGPGLGDLLAGKVELDQAIVNAHPNLDAITAGSPATRIFERLNTSRMDSLLAELRPRYDLIIVDAPPAVVAGEALVLANKVDAIALVVRANHEQRGLVARLIRQFSDLRCEFIGVILNRPRGTAGGYLRKNYATMAEYARGA